MLIVPAFGSKKLIVEALFALSPEPWQTIPTRNCSIAEDGILLIEALVLVVLAVNVTPVGLAFIEVPTTFGLP